MSDYSERMPYPYVCLPQDKCAQQDEEGDLENGPWRPVFPELQERHSPEDAAIKACALMIKGICMTQPQTDWTAKIEARIRFMLRKRADENKEKL